MDIAKVVSIWIFKDRAKKLVFFTFNSFTDHAEVVVELVLHEESVSLRTLKVFGIEATSNLLQNKGLKIGQVCSKSR